MKDGVPTSANFLVRSRDLFGAEGFNVMHYHGYIGMESEAVKAIAEWIRAPASGP
jgi:hypothetical protein